MRVILAMTGGPHTATNPGCCLSVINGVVQFDRAKWDAVMAKFNTATIKNAVAAAVADGTVIGANVMDEPNVCGAGDGNTWGPCGAMTKLRVDSLCGEVQRIFPTLPAGVAHGAGVLAFESDQELQGLPVHHGRGPDRRAGRMRSTWRAATRRSPSGRGIGDAILFNMNVLDGGVPDTDGTYDCTGPGQAGKGTFGNHCRMTATQVRDRGLILGPAGCGLIMWRIRRHVLESGRQPAGVQGRRREAGHGAAESLPEVLTRSSGAIAGRRVTPSGRFAFRQVAAQEVSQILILDPATL